MRRLCRQLGLLALSAGYWLTVTLAPWLHDHSHSSGDASHCCAHHQHAPHAHGGHSQCSHSHRPPQNCRTEQIPRNPSRPPHDPHQHDDDCGVCRFLALKPAPAQAVALLLLRDSLPQDLPVSVPAAGGVSLPLPFSRAPPQPV